MVNKLLGKKIGMTRVFLGDGTSIPVTVLQVGPCVVVQKKSAAKEGYSALQLGFEPQKAARVNRPLKGHFKAAGVECYAYLREVPTAGDEEYNAGDEIRADIFEPGEYVNVSGASRGKGFAGVIKRWGFSGGRMTHGSHSQRIPGSIGSSATPSHVFKGKRLPGRAGGRRVTVKYLQVLDVRPEMNVVLVRGAVPGSRNSLIEIAKA